MDKSKRVIIIPAYNEEKTIGQVVESLIPFSHVIVVDDCSRDRTALFAEKAGAIVFKHEHNKGYEAALNSGFAMAQEKSYLYALTFDADGQHDAKIVSDFFLPLEQGLADLVCGIRPHYARVGEWLMAGYFYLTYGVKDPLCGMKAYRLSYYQSVGFFDSKKLVGAELLIRFSKLGARIKQIHIPIFEREDASRYGSSWKANRKIISALGRALKV